MASGAGTPWTDEENDAIVADYFAMLADDLAGRRPNKAEHNRQLRTRIDRSRASIEFKHRNISAVLKAFAQTWLYGYRPAYNFQDSLIDAVWRWLERNPDLIAPSQDARATTGIRDPGSLYVSPPPTHSNAPPPADLERMLGVARRFDVAGRDERNRALGEAGEALVFEFERATLKVERRPDLAEQVKWVSRDEGDGAGYDIASFRHDGRPRLIEVKTTNGWERTPFDITHNEFAVSEACAGEWCLFRLWNFAREPKAFELYPPLKAHVSLFPTSYEAHFR
ncbi:MAG: DUF3883 domain-containing protein [Rhodospirillaceae bacterium]|nr:DUF3883 domain-containing protein [Rhodospirillaceae bacterium]MDE0617152.1 DUF3883 domain-containing protein [Rhodospirillaceae bacterium]